MKTHLTVGDDKLRYTLALSKTAHEKLTAITSHFKVTQAEAIEVLLREADPQALKAQFMAVRNAKVDARAGRAALRQKLAKLTPEQLVALAAMTAVA